MPLIAREYAERKLQGDPDRLLIHADLETIKKFGAISAPNLSVATHEKQIARFLEWAKSAAISQSVEERTIADHALERLAEYWPSAWLSLGEFRESSGASVQETDYAYRRAVEMQPYRKEAWMARAKYLGRTGDEDGRISSLIAAVDADPKDVPLVREVAFQLCQFINAHADLIPRARRGVYLASVRNNMNRLSDKLDATGLSRLAWLYLLENDKVNALRYARLGLSKEPTNEYCQNLVARLSLD
jgi:tetratricopeptide (TPR) repeat protein